MDVSAQNATETGRTAPGRGRSVMNAPATRRETLLFGLLILATIWVMLGNRPRTVVVVPDEAVRVGIIT
jgi:hypothetical protein